MTCNFCHRPEVEVEKMITGHDDATYICDRCIARCTYLLRLRGVKVIPFDHALPGLAPAEFDKKEI